jgi:hypothetical protein
MKIRVLATALLWCALPLGVSAGPRDSVLEAMGRCASVADGGARLKCYDAVAPQLRSALTTPPATIDHPPTAAEQESWFGFDIGSLFGGGAATTPEQFGKERTPQVQATREQLQIDSITAKVSEVSYTTFGLFIVFLDNGEVWHQLKGDADRVRFTSPVTANRVTISRGALGSYNLTINDSAKTYKVTRIK